MERQDYLYELEFSVRDYECDLLGIVNNAVYQNYLEHARHEFLHSISIDFAKMHEKGKDAVMVRAEIDYKFPLRSRDKFVVRLNLQRKGRLKFIFDQDIYRLPDEKLILKAIVTATCLQNGRPVIPEEIIKAIEKKL